ncbi:hypothetical protein M0R19_01295 [Candidatus Pacearchaeota archaeon]|nr:hypothetical protein [Candidatus Pacearchaeota archaeon]
MKRGIILLFLVVLFSSFISAEIIFNGELKSSYNLGESIFVPVTIKTLSGTSGIFQMGLICNGSQINFYTDGVNLVAGGEKSMNPELVLKDNIIGGSKGFCKVKALLGSDFALSDEFKISDILTITGNLERNEFDSGESITLSGKITRENGENSNGLVESSITTGDINQNITQFGTINDGFFSMNISLPKDLRAGNYFINLRAYEQDNEGTITNKGTAVYNIVIKQVPTNLELVLESKEIMPGSSVKIKSVLHDQTGDSINSTAFLTIKDSADKILQQIEIPTDESLEYFIKTNEPPAEWKVFSVSNKLTAEGNFRIKENEDATIEIINKTILVTNIGNVLYNKTLLIEVGDTPLNLDVTLEIGESKKYFLRAPDGEYQISITDGDDNLSEKMSLTGNTIGVKEISGISFGILFWTFLILVLGFIAFFFFKKIYKRPFFGRMMHREKKVVKKNSNEDFILGEGGKTKAELSLSIKGEKQDASIICVKIKDLKEKKSGRGSASDSIGKIIEEAEDKKAVTYENQDYLFFIFAPIKTKTFKNEKTALESAETILKILNEHNKMFNQKIEFGISLAYGTIIAKLENDIFKFMSLGSLITSAKKIASLSKEEILLEMKMNDLLRLYARTEKKVRDGTPVFSITQVKKENEEARKFIERFSKNYGKK